MTTKREWGGDAERVQHIDPAALKEAYEVATRPLPFGLVIEHTCTMVNLLDYIAHLESARDSLRDALRDAAATPEVTGPQLEKIMLAELTFAVDAAARMLDRPDMNTLAGADRWCTRRAVINARRAMAQMPPEMVAAIEEDAYEPAATGPTTLCNDHVPEHDAPWQCAKCGKPLGPIPKSERVTAEQLAAFAIADGWAWVAVVGLHIEAELGPEGPNLHGSLIRVDGTVDYADGAPPVENELATQLRRIADDIDKNAKERGHGVVRRAQIRPPTTGNN